MKRNIYLASPAALLLAFSLTACTSDYDRDDAATTTSTTWNDVANETREAANTTGDFISEQSRLFAEDAREVYYNLGVKVDELQRDLSAMGNEIQAEFQDEVDDIARKRDEVQRKIDRAGTATEENWEDLKGEINEEMNELDREIEETRREINQRRANAVNDANRNINEAQRDINQVHPEPIDQDVEVEIEDGRVVDIEED